jgi:hypothetical protein
VIASAAWPKFDDVGAPAVMLVESIANSLMFDPNNSERDGSPLSVRPLNIHTAVFDVGDFKRLLDVSNAHRAVSPKLMKSIGIAPFRTFPGHEHGFRPLSVASPSPKAWPSLHFSPESPRTMGLR